MARVDPQVNFRIPEALKTRLEAAAREAKRSLGAEVVRRLEISFEAEPHRLWDRAFPHAAAAVGRTEEESREITGQHMLRYLEMQQAITQKVSLETQVLALENHGMVLHDQLVQRLDRARVTKDRDEALRLADEIEDLQRRLRDVDARVTEVRQQGRLLAKQIQSRSFEIGAPPSATLGQVEIELDEDHPDQITPDQAPEDTVAAQAIDLARDKDAGLAASIKRLKRTPPR